MKITLSRLTTKDLATLVKRIITLSQSEKHLKVNNHPILANLETAYNEYDNVYAKQMYSGKGKEVADADELRDDAYNNLKAYLKGYRKLPSAANRPWAEDLYKVIQSFGLSIDRLSYSSQTAQVKKLIEALETPDNAQKLAGLSLTIAFNEIKNTQTTFEQIFAGQAEANADLRQMTSASSIRNNLQEKLKSYFNFVLGMKEITGWESLYADINENVKAAKNSTELKPKEDKL